MTRNGFVSAVAAAGLALAVALPIVGHAQGKSQKQNGYNVAPVPLNTSGLNPALVGEGSYIVNAQGGCNDCHTAPSYAPGGDPFAGEPEAINQERYLAGGGIFGPFTSRNLTPRGNGLPAGLTLAQFIEAMRHGTDFKSSTPRILQVMPWPVYGKMNDRELEAIYEFLRAIPCIGSAMRCGS